jgi:hypothetical protein
MISEYLNFIVETPIPKANNLKVTIGAAELDELNNPAERRV